MSEDYVTKEVLDLHMTHIRDNLNKIGKDMGAITLLAKEMGESNANFRQVKEKVEALEVKTGTNEKYINRHTTDIKVLNTHKKYISGFFLVTIAVISAWFRSLIK